MLPSAVKIKYCAAGRRRRDLRYRDGRALPDASASALNPPFE